MKTEQKIKKLSRQVTMVLAFSLSTLGCSKESEEVESPAVNPVEKNELSVADKAAGANTVQESSPINFTTHVYCDNNEDVVLTGSMHTVRHVVDNGNSRHTVVKNTIKLTGVGQTTGNRYQGNYVFTSVNNFNNNTAVTINLGLNRVVSQGPNKNETIRIFARGTITPDGRFVADWETTTIECK